MGLVIHLLPQRLGEVQVHHGGIGAVRIHEIDKVLPIIERQQGIGQLRAAAGSHHRRGVPLRQRIVCLGVGMLHKVALCVHIGDVRHIRRRHRVVPVLVRYRQDQQNQRRQGHHNQRAQQPSGRFSPLRRRRRFLLFRHGVLFRRTAFRLFRRLRFRRLPFRHRRAGGFLLQAFGLLPSHAAQGADGLGRRLARRAGAVF